MDRRAALGTLVGLGTTALAGCTGSASRDSGASFDVGMSTSEFRPARIEVPVGETVVWKNTSSHAHTVTAYDASLPAGAEYFASGGFQHEEAARVGWRQDGSGGLFEGDTYEHTFEVADVFPYFCIPHEEIEMKGVVRVTDS